MRIFLKVTFNFLLYFFLANEFLSDLQALAESNKFNMLGQTLNIKKSGCNILTVESHEKFAT